MLTFLSQLDQTNEHSSFQLPTAVFNEDLGGQYSSEMQRLAKSFQVHHIKYRQYHSMAEAVEAVERGQAVAALWFEKDFSSALTKRALASIVKTEEGGENDYGEIEEHIDDDEEDEEVVDDNDVRLNELEKKSFISTMSTTTTATTTSENEADEMTTTTTNDSLLKNTSTFETTTTTTEVTTTILNAITNKNSSLLRRLRKRSKNEDDEDEDEEHEEEETEDEELQREGNYVKLSNQTLRTSNMKLFIDNSNVFYAQPLTDMLRFASWELLNKVVADNGELTVASPVVVQEIVYAEGTETPDFLLSGYMIAFLYLSQVTLSSQLLIQERKDGFFDRTIVAGAKHWLLFFSHFITNFLFSFVQIAFMFLVGFTWYNIPNFGSYWLCFVLALLQSASSIMTGK